MATVPVELRRAARGKRDAFYWRFVVTALSFSLFGVGVAIVGLVLLPLVRLAPGARLTRRRRARRVVQLSARSFVGMMHRLGGLTYDFRGAERLGRPGQLIVANHPSLIDVLFLIAFTPNANCVVKHGLWRNPLTRGAVRLAEYIDNGATHEMIERSSAALRDGQALIMFPEGTRTRPNEPPTFHRGAANVALRAAQSVTPVYIRCEPTTLTKAEPWWRIPPRRPHFALVVGEDLPLEPYRDGALPLASRRLNEHLHAQFRRVLA